MLYEDMMVETPILLTEIDILTEYAGHPDEHECTGCLARSSYPWYGNEDVMVLRHWTSVSVNEPGGGKWTWYCPEHFEKRAGNWWPNSHRAPAKLLPVVEHSCDHVSGRKFGCNEYAVEPFDGVWLCEVHANAERVSRRFDELLSD